MCESFLAGLKPVLGEKLYAVYIYGAAVFPDTLPTGDVDFHVILIEGCGFRMGSAGVA